MLGVMAELNIDPYYFPGIMAQIQQESAGYSDAVNGWDSNWRIGYASYGLLQTIAPTYRTYAKPGYAGTLTYKTVNGRRQQFQEPVADVPLHEPLRGIELRHLTLRLLKVQVLERRLQSGLLSPEYVGDERGDRRPLGPGEGDVGEQRVPLQFLHHRHDAVVTAHA